MGDNNATALHKISVMVDEMDTGATTTVTFIEQYGWYILISIVGCLALCIISTCYGYCRSISRCCCDFFRCFFRCLFCGCGGKKPKHHRLRDNEV